MAFGRSVQNNKEIEDKDKMRTLLQADAAPTYDQITFSGLLKQAIVEGSSEA